MSKAVKIKIHNTMAKPPVVFGSEMWAMTEMDMKRLGTWRISDQELRQLYKDLDTVADIKKKRLEWVGPVVGMDQGRMVKKIFESKLEGRRRKGRPRCRWLEDVGKDIREMKVKRW
jgi:hypothetical protein